MHASGLESGQDNSRQGCRQSEQRNDSKAQASAGRTFSSFYAASIVLNVMQVDLIDLICYSCDASCLFHVRPRTSVFGHASDRIIGANHQHDGD
jgi:hypothetical protein